jgi:hypothetical protein
MKKELFKAIPYKADRRSLCGVALRLSERRELMNKLKKAIAAACCAVFLAGFTGCTAAENDSAADSVSNSSAATLSAQEVLEELDGKISESTLDSSAFYSDETFENNAKKLYAIEYADLADGGILYDGTGGSADEISMIKPADGDEDYAVKALEARKEMRIRDFTGYKPEELDKIEDAEIFSQNGWAVLIISDNAADIAKTLKTMI